VVLSRVLSSYPSEGLIVAWRGPKLSNTVDMLFTSLDSNSVRRG